jgi:hypothetical protein
MAEYIKLCKKSNIPINFVNQTLLDDIDVKIRPAKVPSLLKRRKAEKLYAEDVRNANFCRSEYVDYEKLTNGDCPRCL